MDWESWHDAYDDPDSWLARRLATVRLRIREALDVAPPGPLRVISLVAGQGRDVLDVLADHPRRDDVRARLVELDPRNTAAARATARAAGLDQVEVVTADASLTDGYRGMAPADLVLICGLFGNITDEDIERTVDACTQFCKPGGTVVWTRGREVPDRFPRICDWFESRAFERLWVSDPEAVFGVGVHRFHGVTRPLAEGTRLFTFIGYDVLHARGPGTPGR